MTGFNGTKTREYKSGNTSSTGTLAKGEYFNDEFDQLYGNDNHLEDTKFDRSGGTVSGDMIVEGNAIFKGDVSIAGTATKINTTDLDIKDNIITLNKGESGAGVTAGQSGIEIDRGTLAKAKILWDETIGRWVSGFAGSLYTLITANDVGNASGKIPVSNGEVNTNLNAAKLDGADLSTDGLFASLLDTLVPTVKAVWTFVKNLILKPETLYCTASYAQADTDTYTEFKYNCTSADCTHTLPTPTANQRVRISHISGVSCKVIIVAKDGSAILSADRMSAFWLTQVGDWAEFQYNVSLGIWEMIGHKITCELAANGGAYGSGDTCIKKYTTITSDVGNLMSHNYSSYGSHGLETTIAKSGLYIIFDNIACGPGGAAGISINSTQLTTSIQNISRETRAACNIFGSIYSFTSIMAIRRLKKGDIIRHHGDSGSNDYTAETTLIQYLGA